MRPDAVFERLKRTKQFGLLFSDHLVNWTGRSGRPTAKETVPGRDDTPGPPDPAYIGRFLKGLVPAGQISIAADDIRRALGGQIAPVGSEIMGQGHNSRLNGTWIGRREFNRLCATFGLALPTVAQ